MNTPWRVHLLGELCAVQAERTLTRFRTHKTAVLLAYFALHPQPVHPREELVELLWPEAAPDTARNNLSTALSSLRHQLEPPGVSSGSVLQADRFRVGLNPAAFRTD